MSPYMRAYEAGIKLAQLEWMSKVANTPTQLADQFDEQDDLVITEDQMRNYVDPDAGTAQADEAAPAQAQGARQTEMVEPIKEDAPTPEYFTARGGYGTMARNLRKYYQDRYDATVNNAFGSPEYARQSDALDYRFGQLGDVTGRELSQIYGNQMFRAGDQLDMDDMAARLEALRNKDTEYSFGGVDVQRGGRTVSLGGRQQAPRRGSRSAAQVPTPAPQKETAQQVLDRVQARIDARASREQEQPADYIFTDEEIDNYTPPRETATQLLDRIQANPGRTYENVVMPTYNPPSELTSGYQAPSGRGDLGGGYYTTRMQTQGGNAGIRDRRAAADNSARLQGLQRSISSGSRSGPDGQGARFRQLQDAMNATGRNKVNLIDRSGKNFTMDRARLDSQVQGYNADRNLSRPNITSKPGIPSRAPTSLPQFNLNPRFTGSLNQ